jgi:phage-related protein
MRTPRVGHSKRSVWLGGAIKSPPFSDQARHYAGGLIRRVQRGVQLAMPLSRPMPGVGERCHELRVADGDVDWRIIYRIDPNAILIVDVFRKTTRSTPRHVIDLCKWRLKRYDQRRKAR